MFEAGARPLSVHVHLPPEHAPLRRDAVWYGSGRIQLLIGKENDHRRHARAGVLGRGGGEVRREGGRFATRGAHPRRRLDREASGMRALPAVELIDHRKDGPILLVGEPRRLVGRFKLHNPADSRVVVRGARLCGAPVAHAHKRDELQEFPISLTAILAPNERSAVTVKVAVDADTPPGDYAAELVLGEHRYPVQLLIAESISLSVTPAEIVIENHPGERLTKRLYFTNDGNVPMNIGNIGAVVLDDELLACKTMRATLDTSSKEAKTLQEGVSIYIAQAKRQLEATGLLG